MTVHSTYCGPKPFPELLSLVSAVKDLVHSAPATKDAPWTNAGWDAYSRLKTAYSSLLDAAKTEQSGGEQR